MEPSSKSRQLRMKTTIEPKSSSLQIFENDKPNQKYESFMNSFQGLSSPKNESVIVFNKSGTFISKSISKTQERSSGDPVSSLFPRIKNEEKDNGNASIQLKEEELEQRRTEAKKGQKQKEESSQNDQNMEKRQRFLNKFQKEPSFNGRRAKSIKKELKGSNSTKNVRNKLYGRFMENEDQSSLAKGEKSFGDAFQAEKPGKKKKSQSQEQNLIEKEKFWEQNKSEIKENQKRLQEFNEYFSRDQKTKEKEPRNKGTSSSSASSSASKRSVSNSSKIEKEPGRSFQIKKGLQFSSTKKEANNSKSTVSFALPLSPRSLFEKVNSSGQSNMKHYHFTHGLDSKFDEIRHLRETNRSLAAKVKSLERELDSLNEFRISLEKSKDPESFQNKRIDVLKGQLTKQSKHIHELTANLKLVKKFFNELQCILRYLMDADKECRGLLTMKEVSSKIKRRLAVQHMNVPVTESEKLNQILKLLRSFPNQEVGQRFMSSFIESYDKITRVLEKNADIEKNFRLEAQSDVNTQLKIKRVKYRNTLKEFIDKYKPLYPINLKYDELNALQKDDIKKFLEQMLHVSSRIQKNFRRIKHFDSLKHNPYHYAAEIPQVLFDNAVSFNYYFKKRHSFLCLDTDALLRYESNQSMLLSSLLGLHRKLMSPERPLELGEVIQIEKEMTKCIEETLSLGIATDYNSDDSLFFMSSEGTKEHAAPSTLTINGNTQQDSSFFDSRLKVSSFIQAESQNEPKSHFKDSVSEFQDQEALGSQQGKGRPKELVCYYKEDDMIQYPQKNMGEIEKSLMKIKNEMNKELNVKVVAELSKIQYHYEILSYQVKALFIIQSVRKQQNDFFDKALRETKASLERLSDYFTQKDKFVNEFFAEVKKYMSGMKQSYEVINSQKAILDKVTLNLEDMKFRGQFKSVLDMIEKASTKVMDNPFYNFLDIETEFNLKKNEVLKKLKYFAHKH